MAGGRPPIFKTPDELSAAWEAYKQRKSDKQDLICKDNFLTESGNYLGLFFEYAKKPEYSKAIERIEQDCKYYLINKAIKNEYNSTIAKVLLSANYGLREKTETDNTNHNIETTYEQFIARADEARKNAKQAKKDEEEEV